MYDNKPFKLQGAIDMVICFGGKELTTPVYIKMYAEDQLWHFERLCRQLGVGCHLPPARKWPGN